jgi:VIT1/CCC1 family predicted Fe2+/Mn2+ transporter
MSQQPRRLRFVERHLDPGDRLAEFLCGLIMVLTFTLGAGLTIEDGPDAALSLVLAAIGCNIAWGIIDGVLYVLTEMSDRNLRVRFARAVHAAPDDAAAQAVIRTEVEERVGAFASPAARDALGQAMLVQLRSEAGAQAAVAEARASRVTADDLLGAVAIFWLELLACVPAIIPFFVLPHDHLLALRISNGLLIVMLFIVGYKWAGYAGLNRWLVGLVMSGIGLALVVVALLLGG